jgi:hypothetical protein
MQWLDFPAMAECEDRSGMVRRIYGCTVLGRFEFAQRMAVIGRILEKLPNDRLWEQEYCESPRLRAAIDGALACWGLKAEWFAAGQIEALLLFRLEEGMEAKPGWLVELLNPPNPLGKGEPEAAAATLAETIAAISTHCASLEEAMNLAANVPVDLLGDVLKSRAKQGAGGDAKDRAREDHLKRNYDRLMAAGD